VALTSAHFASGRLSFPPHTDGISALTAKRAHLTTRNKMIFEDSLGEQQKAKMLMLESENAAGSPQKQAEAKI